MLADLVEKVIGVDTHRDTHTAALISSPGGGVLAHHVAQVCVEGYEGLVEWADESSSAADRVWAIEGTGSYGAGLSDFLQQRGEFVIEIDRPGRPKRRMGTPKSDLDDAIAAARHGLGTQNPCVPRARGDREALRVRLATRDQLVRQRTAAINLVKASIVTAPAGLRAAITADKRNTIAVCAELEESSSGDSEYSNYIAILGMTARRILGMEAEIAEHTKVIESLTQQRCPQLLAEAGVGPITAAQIYISWSHPGRCRNEAAFANLAGTAPIQASSGQTQRHRLNRGGDRQLNRALHIVLMSRARNDERTQQYFIRRQHQGKSTREAKRCLKRYLARHFYRILENPSKNT